MRKSTALLRVLSTNAVQNAKSGKARISITKNPEPKTDWGHGVKTAIWNICESVIGKWERV